MTGQEVDGKYQNFNKFPLLSLLVDTSGGFQCCQNRNFDFG